jgi:hypothetical protein
MYVCMYVYVTWLQCYGYDSRMLPLWYTATFVCMYVRTYSGILRLLYVCTYVRIYVCMYMSHNYNVMFMIARMLPLWYIATFVCMYVSADIHKCIHASGYQIKHVISGTRPPPLSYVFARFSTSICQYLRRQWVLSERSVCQEWLLIRYRAEYRTSKTVGITVCEDPNSYLYSRGLCTMRACYVTCHVLCCMLRWLCMRASIHAYICMHIHTIKHTRQEYTRKRRLTASDVFICRGCLGE